MKKTINFLTWTLGVILFCGSHANAQVQQAPQAPHFHLLSLEGTVYTDRYLIGQPTLLIFWNSWCELCPTELPKIYALQEKMGRKRFRALAIAIGDTEANVRAYVTSHPMHFNFPVLYDFGDRVAMDYDVNRVPTFFLLNEKGELELAYQGEGFLEYPQFQPILHDLLDLPPIEWPTAQAENGHVRRTSGP